jgi:hypothetical protein
MKPIVKIGGWSTLEAAICLAISTALAFAATPQITRIGVAIEAKLLAEVIRAMRYRAAAERRDYVLSYQSGVCSAVPNQPGLAGLCKHLYARSPSSLTLYPNGVATPATLQLEAENTRCVVSLSLRGRVRVSCSGVNAR